MWMKTGTVYWFSKEKGYGFVEPDDGGGDIFVPQAVINQAGLASLAEGQKLRFSLETDGSIASAIQALGPTQRYIQNI